MSSLAQELRELGFAPGEALQVLRWAQMDLRDFAAERNRELQAAKLGAQMFRTEEEAARAVLAPQEAAELIRLRDELPVAIERFKTLEAQGNWEAATEADKRAAVITERLYELYQAWEEGPEQQMPSPGEEQLELAVVGVFEDFYDRVGRFGGRGEPSKADLAEHLRYVLAYKYRSPATLKRWSDDKVIQRAKEIMEPRLQRIGKMRTSQVFRQEAGEPEEHVRIEHEIARMRAARIPPALREEIMGHPVLIPNRTARFVEAAESALARGLTPPQAMREVVAAGAPPRLAYLAVRDAEAALR